MRYLVTARVRHGLRAALRRAIGENRLGRGSVAGDEYRQNIELAREMEDGRVQWVETCFCSTPLLEERPYWEEYFHLNRVQDAHDRRRCRDLNGEEAWACSSCDCTSRLENRLAGKGRSFLDGLDGDDR